MLNPTPQAQEGGDGGRGGNQVAQVTIYGPLVTVVLSLRPAPSEKWCPLLNPVGGLPPSPRGTEPFGTGGPAGEQGAERLLWRAHPALGQTLLSSAWCHTGVLAQTASPG